MFREDVKHFKRPKNDLEHLAMTDTREMVDEDIAKDVLDNICNMNGVEKNIEVNNFQQGFVNWT